MGVIPQRQVHLDFHTSEHIKGIGSKFSKEQFISCLKKGHINSITVFAKCHHGVAYFPSKTIHPHPYLEIDLLSEMLDACREAGVEAPVYISAGLDMQYVFEHPEHSIIDNRNGTHATVAEEDGVKFISDRPHAHYRRLCMNTPYLDHLVKQVEEVVERYRPIGIFLDIVGECVCYCENCRRTAREMGLDENDDASFIEVAKVVYKKYYTAINEAATRIKPDIRIFHNSGHIKCGRRDLAHANTHLEIESLPTGGWGYDHFPKTARYAMGLGMEYLGMTGKFHGTWGEFGGYKHPNALKYEVALSLANGAKCSVGDQMHPYGFLDDATYELIGQAYSDAEKLEEYCYDTTSVADIALLSLESYLVANNPPADAGACRMMLEGKYLYNVVDEDNDLSGYKLVIIPDGVKFSEALQNKLRAFVEGGGKLLMVGGASSDGKSTHGFDLGVELLGAGNYNPAYYHPHYNALGLTSATYLVREQMYKTRLTDNSAVALGYSRDTFFNRTPKHFCSHQHTPYVEEDSCPAVVIGKDGAYIAWDIFNEYATVGSIIHKDTFIKVVDELLGDKKTLKTNLGSAGVITLTDQKDKKRFVLHTLYAVPQTRGNGVQVIEDLPTIYGTTIELKLPVNVKKIYDALDKSEVAFTQDDDLCRITIDSFTCSKVLVIEY